MTIPPVAEHSLAKSLATATSRASIAFALAAAISFVVSFSLQAILSSSEPYGDLPALFYWSLRAAIITVGCLLVIAGIAYSRRSRPSLKLLIAVSLTAVLLAGLLTSWLLGPFAGAFSIPPLPGWVAGALAASLALAPPSEALKRSNGPLPPLRPAVIAGVIAGALPVVAVVIISFFI